MRKDLFRPTEEGEARLLILIASFSKRDGGLEGRTKLAKLDFLLRYPRFLERAINIRGVAAEADILVQVDDIESRMVRYRYGPWDPAYFALLGRLLGKGLVQVGKTEGGGVAYSVTDSGRSLVKALSTDEEWALVVNRAGILRKHFNRSGSWLKDFLYKNFPEVASAQMGDLL